MPGHRLCGLLDFDMPETKKKPFSSVIEPPIIPASFAPVSRYVPRLRMGQSPCPSRRVQAGFGPLFRRCEEASIQSICRPRRFTKDEKQSRRKPWRFYSAWAVTSARSAGGFRGRRLTLFRRERDLVDADFWKRTGKASSWGIFCDAYLGCQPFSGG